MSSALFTRTFWEDTTERAIKSAAQGMLLAITGGVVNILTVNWMVLLGAGGGAALYSVLTSLASDALPFGSKGTASLSNAVEPSR